MGGDVAIGSEGEDHVRMQGAEEIREPACDFVKVFAIQRTVGVVQDLAVSDAEEMAGGGKLLAADGLERFVLSYATTVGGPLSGGEADDRALDAGFGILGENSTEASGFIIGMRGDTEQL